MTTTKERLVSLLSDTFKSGLAWRSPVTGAYADEAVADIANELNADAHTFLASVGLAPEPESPATIDAALDQLPPAEREAVERRYPGLDQERTDAVTYTDSSGTTLLVTRPTPPPPPPPPLASEDATPFDDDDDEAAAPATPRKKRTATKRKAK